MAINNFCDLLKEKIDNLLKKGTIKPSNGSDDYHRGDWTFLMNCAIYETVKDLDLFLCAEPRVGEKPKGRGGYSDFTIYSNDEKKKEIVIEHEQDSITISFF